MEDDARDAAEPTIAEDDVVTLVAPDRRERRLCRVKLDDVVAPAERAPNEARDCRLVDDEHAAPQSHRRGRRMDARARRRERHARGGRRMERARLHLWRKARAQPQDASERRARARLSTLLHSRPSEERRLLRTKNGRAT